MQDAQQCERVQSTQRLKSRVFLVTKSWTSAKKRKKDLRCERQRCKEEAHKISREAENVVPAGLILLG